MSQDAVWEVLTSENGTKTYEGFTLLGKPYGAGTTYFPDGNKYQEGIFFIKGLLYGREYYPSGQVRFEGAYRLCAAYGPNYPVYGKCYDPSGEMYFEGQFTLRFGGVGYPIVVVPEQFGEVSQSERPEIEYFRWSDAESLQIPWK